MGHYAPRRPPVVDPETGCWNWAGPQRKGYGRWGQSAAHRVSYERSVGPIPDGLEIDHLCRNTLCINPEHLEPVTPEENRRRRHAAYTHCINGHEFTPENTRVSTGPVGNRRHCRACARAASAAYKARRGGVRSQLAIEATQ